MSRDRALEDIEDLLNTVFESLANPVRRKILEVLVNGGPLPYTEIMRRCGIKDSKTLKHHLDKLGPLVAKDRSGAYVVTKIGREAIKIAETFRETLLSILTLYRSSTPLISFRSSVRHYTFLAIALLSLSIAIAVAGFVHAAIVAVVASLALLILACLERARIVIVGRSSVIELIESPVKSSRKIVRGKIIGVEISTNALLRVLGLARVSVIIDSESSLRIYSLGIATIDSAKRFADAVNSLVSGANLHTHMPS